jgi:hypothetical protein
MFIPADHGPLLALLYQFSCTTRPSDRSRSELDRQSQRPTTGRRFDRGHCAIPAAKARLSRMLRPPARREGWLFIGRLHYSAQPWPHLFVPGAHVRWHRLRALDWTALMFRGAATVTVRLSELSQLSHARLPPKAQEQGTQSGSLGFTDVRIDQLLPFQASRTSLRRSHRLRTRNRPGFRRVRR